MNPPTTTEETKEMLEFLKEARSIDVLNEGDKVTEALDVILGDCNCREGMDVTDEINWAAADGNNAWQEFLDKKIEQITA